MSLFFTGSWRAGMRIRHGQRRYLQPYDAHMLQSVSERLKLSMCVGRDTEVQLPITRSHVGSCSFVLKKMGEAEVFAVLEVPYGENIRPETSPYGSPGSISALISPSARPCFCLRIFRICPCTQATEPPNRGTDPISTADGKRLGTT